MSQEQDKNGRTLEACLKPEAAADQGGAATADSAGGGFSGPTGERAGLWQRRRGRRTVSVPWPRNW
jgi:hypothetical protein